MSSGALEPAVRSRVAMLGERILDAIDRAGRFVLLVLATLRAARRPRFPCLVRLRQL